MNKKDYIVISLGGSLIVPGDIDSDFLKMFTDVIKSYVEQGFRFVIITGGGKVSRNYGLVAKGIATPTNEDLDWIGIRATRLNAELLRVIFGDLSHDEIVLNPDIMPNTEKPIIVGGGWKPGNSSDLASVHIASSIGAKTIINLSNIDYAYDKDPNKFPDAKIIEKISWADFRTLIPNEWNPNLSSPFDPIAAGEAESSGLEVIIMNGKNVENLKRYLNGEEFVGTVIS